MSDIEISIGVRNKRVAQDIEDDIRSGIRKGGVEIGAEAEKVAKERIREVGAIFTGDLLRSFDIEIRKRGNRIQVTLKNTSGHAAPIEYGAEYTDRGPPVVALIPWVQTKMIGFQVPEEDLEDLPDPQTVEEDTTIPEPGGSVTDLANVVSESTLTKAFWLQQHIKEQGIDAVRYMRRAQKWAEKNADRTVSQHINREIRA